MLADLFPSTVSEQGLLLVMAEFTGAILLVVGIGIVLFAHWAKKEKSRREREVNTAINLKR